jgi:CBS domain-containing protein
MMRERNVGSVVLIEEQRPVGFLTDRDLTVSVLADGRDLGDHAADHASSPVITASAEMRVEEAAELMVRHGVRRLVIVDGERLTGILTLDDITSRTGDAELAAQLSTRVTRAVMPDFFFHERGDH